MTEPEDKSKRLRERIKLSLPARVTCRETAEHEWVEMTRLIDVTPFGASFMLTHPTEPGRLLHLVLPLPRQLRCFDHAEDQYRVWALVRRVRPVLPEGAKDASSASALLRFEVGVGFTGKHPPQSFRDDPSTLYDVDVLSAESNLWTLRERKKDTAGGRGQRSAETRLQMALGVTVEVFDEQGRVCERETTITENISRRGAAVLTSLKLSRGRFIRLTSAESGMSLTAVVRATRTGADNIPRLHVEFVDRKWPLEGLE
jgi:hypothetical protein